MTSFTTSVSMQPSSGFSLISKATLVFVFYHQVMRNHSRSFGHLSSADQSNLSPATSLTPYYFSFYPSVGFKHLIHTLSASQPDFHTVHLPHKSLYTSSDHETLCLDAYSQRGGPVRERHPVVVAFLRLLVYFD